MQVVLGAAGAIAGGILTGSPQGAQLGWALGSTLGGLVAGGEKTKNRQQIGDLNVPGIEDGRPINWLRGSMRLAVDWIANTDRIAIEHTESSSSGGKGGGPSVENTTYTYEMDALVLLTVNPGVGCAEAYRQSELIWRTDSGASSGTIQASAESEHWDRLTIYDGNPAQLPDPDYLASFGVANAPAYRGRMTAFIKRLKLGSSGQVPLLEFTAVIDGTHDSAVFNDYEFASGMSAPLYIPDCDVVRVTSTNEIWVVDARYNYNWPNDDNKCRIAIFDLESQTWTGFVDFPDETRAPGGTDGSSTNRLWYIPEWDVVMLSCRGGSKDSNTAVYDVQSRTLNGTYNDLAAFVSRYSYGANAIQIDVARKRVFCAANVYEYTVWQLDEQTLLPIDEIGHEYINDNFARLGIGCEFCDNDGNFWYPTDPGTDITGTWARSWQKMIRSTGYNRVHVALDADMIGYSGGSNVHDICFDPTRNAIFYWDASRSKLKKLDCSAHTISTIGTYANGASDPGGKKLFYDSTRDRIVIIVTAGTPGNVWWIDPDDGSIEQTIVIPNPGGARFDSGQLAFIPGYGLYGSGGIGASGYLNELLFDQLTIACPTVRDVQESVFTRAGLDAADYDCSPLDAITRDVCCMPWSQITGAREPTERLASVYFYSITMSGSKIKCIPRGETEVATIPFDDLGAVMADGGGSGGDDDRLPLRVVNDIETPAHDVLNYINLAQNYRQGSVKTDRIVSATPVSVNPLEVAIGLQPAEAKGVIDTFSRDAASALLRGRCTVLRADYPTLEPGDCFIGEDRDGSQWRLRIVQAVDAFPLLTLDYVLDDPNVLSSQGITTTDFESQTSVAMPPTTELLLLDGPILQDADDFAGAYALVKGDQTRWPGGAVLDSDDDVTFTNRASITENAVFGTCSTILQDWTGPRVIDWKSTVTVNVGDGTLTSSTRDAVLGSQEVNAYRIGSEEGQFITATIESTAPNIYTLSGLLRGSRGTEWAMIDHAAGEDFALLRRAGMRRISIDNAKLGVARYYKGVTIGRAATSATSQNFTIEDGGLKPFSPIDGRVTRDGSNNATLTIKRRTRLAVRVVGTLGISIPLGEETEAYQWDFYTSGTYATLADSQTSTAASLSYSAAQQTSAGLTPGATLYCIVRQLSSVAGLGYELRIAA